MAKGTVYLYFSSKETLFLELMEEQFNLWFSEVNNGLLVLSDDLAGDEEILVLFKKSLESHKMLPKMIITLHTVLEQNINFATALRFKQCLAGWMNKTASLLEKKVSYLSVDKAGWLLMRLYALVIGFMNMANQSPVIEQVLKEPGMAIFKVDFGKEIISTMAVLLGGIKNS